MLLEKPMASGDVVSRKVVNGDEIIARLESDDEKTVSITKPLAITAGPQGLGMIPWIFLGDDKGDVKIRQSSIVTVCKPKKDALISISKVLQVLL